MTTTTKEQVKKFHTKYKDGEDNATLTATVRYDDRCGNGHNTFSITGDLVVRGKRGNMVYESGGCLHKEIAQHFPELAPLIKWHLCSSDGPMYYIQNTVYLASDRDYWGLRKGEFKQHTSRGKHQAGGVEGVPCWTLEMPDVSHVYANDKPAPMMLEWKPSGRTGEGKDRELDLARSAAIWPDATDEELTAPGLEERLKARLPGLLAEFRKAVESLDFVF